MNVGGDGGKRKSGPICLSLLPRSLYCILYCCGLCWTMSDDGKEGWSNGYWCCWGGGHRTRRRGSAVVRLLKYGQKASRLRLHRHTRSDRLAGR
jgi:hypothetical protein